LRGAAGIDLGTTIKYLRSAASAAAGNGLSTTIKYLRRTTSAAAGNGQGQMIDYLRRTMSATAGNDLSRYRGIIDVPIYHKRPAFFFFCACLRRQQAE
jgi:uncharacterized protein YfiM (DUF2279 family)